MEIVRTGSPQDFRSICPLFFGPIKRKMVRVILLGNILKFAEKCRLVRRVNRVLFGTAASRLATF